jgi:hypothetical protein
MGISHICCLTSLITRQADHLFGLHLVATTKNFGKLGKFVPITRPLLSITPNFRLLKRSLRQEGIYSLFRSPGSPVRETLAEAIFGTEKGFNRNTEYHFEVNSYSRGINGFVKMWKINESGRPPTREEMQKEFDELVIDISAW